MSIEHINVNSIHKFAYVQSTDPGAVGAYKGWVDTTTTPYVLKIRNGTNTGWDVVGASGGGGGTPTGAAGGILAGTYPNPSFAVDMATQAELNAVNTAKEDKSNKSTDGTFTANSDTLYPSQKAVKTYVDANIAIDTGGDLVTLADYDGTLAGAVSAIATAGNPPVVLSITEPITVSSNLTIPANILLEPRALITLTSGITLNVASMVDVGNRRIFNTSASSSKVIFQKGAVPRYRIAWWVNAIDGADVTGATWQAIQSCNYNAGGIITYPEGRFVTSGLHFIGDSITIEGSATYVLNGFGGTTLKLASPIDDYLFVIGEGEYAITFKDLLLDGTGTTGKTAILMQGTYPNTSGYFSFDHVVIQGFAIGIDHKSLGGDWQLAQVSMYDCIFQSNMIGYKCNSVNAQLTTVNTNFSVPVDGIGIKFDKAGLVNLLGSEFAGAFQKTTITAVDTTTNRVTATGHGILDGQEIVLTTTGVFPGNLQTRMFAKYIDANTLQFSLTSGGAAVDITSAGSGILNLFRPSAIGIQINGRHGAINIQSSQDEGFEIFLENNFDDYSAVINIYGGSLIQGKLMMNGICHLNVTDCNITSHCLQGDATNGFASFKDCHIREDDANWGAFTPINPPVLSQLTGGMTVTTEDLPMTGYSKRRYPRKFISGANATGYATRPIVEIGNDTGGVDENKVLFRLSQVDDDEVAEYYYDYTWNHATGWITVDSNRADPNKGFLYNLPVAIGMGGTAISSLIKGTVSINPPSIAANTATSINVTITGATVGSTVILNPPTAGLTAGLVVGQAYISALNQVTVVIYNTTAGAIDESAGTWTYTIIKS